MEFDKEDSSWSDVSTEMMHRRRFKAQVEFCIGQIVEGLQQSLRETDDRVLEYQMETSDLRHAHEKIVEGQSVMDDRLQTVEAYFHEEQETLKSTVHRNASNIAALYDTVHKKVPRDSFNASQVEDLKLELQTMMSMIERRLLERVTVNEGAIIEIDRKLTDIWGFFESRLTEMDNISARMDTLTLELNVSSIETLVETVVEGLKRTSYEEFDFLADLKDLPRGNVSLAQELRDAESACCIDHTKGNELSPPHPLVSLVVLKIQLVQRVLPILRSVWYAISRIADTITRAMFAYLLQIHSHLLATFKMLSPLHLWNSWSWKCKQFLILWSICFCIISYLYMRHFNNFSDQDLNGRMLPRSIRRQFQRTYTL